MIAGAEASHLEILPLKDYFPHPRLEHPGRFPSGSKWFEEPAFGKRSSPSLNRFEID